MTSSIYLYTLGYLVLLVRRENCGDWAKHWWKRNLV